MGTEDRIKSALLEKAGSLGAELSLDEIGLEHPKFQNQGDLSSSLALRLAKTLHDNPRNIAQKIADGLKIEGVDHVEIAGPGFINFFLSQDNIVSIVSKIVNEGEHYGDSDVGKHEKTLLEYVSANPTGALHLGHARGAAVGDSLARILKKAGYDVTREYYVNDAGVQIDHLAESLKARYYQALGDDSLQVPDDGYHGEDIVAFAKRLVEEGGDSYKNAPMDFFKEKGTEMALGNIKKDLKDFRVEFDVFTSEKAIRKAGKVEEVIKELKPYCYTKDGALFLNTTKDGDDKDRVIIKSDGHYTYLLPDIAYHKDKFDRGYEYLIDLFGADHHGYVARLKSSLKSLGYNPDKLYVDLVQMVRLFKDGQEYKMSKRTGNAVSLRELCEEAGVDAVRYYFVSRAASQHLDFNIDLAKTMGNSNPVYYCQYAYARLCNMLRQAEGVYELDYSGKGLDTDSEKELMKKLAEYPEVVKDSALTLSPYKITIYVRELASLVNDFYTKCRVLDSENKALSGSRLGLCKAASIVIKDALNLIGVSAPEHM